MKRIPASTIDAILTQTDIVGLIGQHVDLQKSGSEYKGCCPFHQEKTPSFFVSPKKQFFHCFGCSESGNAITFLRKKQNLDFPTAVRQLADAAGMEIPELSITDDNGGEFAEMYELMEKAASIYQSALTSAAASAARDYIESRGFPARVVEQFELGYAPDSWDFILGKLGKSKEQRALLEEVGLITSSVNGQSRLYDRFRGRLMFPIRDRRGRVVGFGGRVINNGEPKYLNSPETPLFKKGREIFGMHQSIGAIRNAKRVLLVEGYTDVLALAANGIETAVASLGTATTQEQLQMLFDTVPEVVFCYDGDSAGARAGLRTLETVLPLLEDGRIASFVFLPEGQDPDSLVRSAGGIAFEQYVADNAMPFDMVLLRDLLDRNNRSVAPIAKALIELRPRIQSIPGEILKGLIIGRISTETNLPYKFVRRQLLG